MIGVTAGSARAFWIAAPGRGEIRAEAVPSPSADEVLVRALYSGISRGTESLVFQGRVPASDHQRMRAPFQDGEFPGPVKYGYASVGRVEHGPRELQNRDVFVLYPVLYASLLDPQSAGHAAALVVLAARNGALLALFLVLTCTGRRLDTEPLGS